MAVMLEWFVSTGSEVEWGTDEIAGQVHHIVHA
jgi:hypothetical protein